MRGLRLRLLEMGFGHVGRSNCVWTVGNVVWMGGRGGCVLAGVVCMD